MKWLGIGMLALALLLGAGLLYQRWNNTRVVAELRADPDGELAKKVMLLTLPSGRSLPVNYLREGETVYAAADFPWWRELRGGGGRGEVLVQGETRSGRIRALTDDPELRDQVFERLRPSAPRFFGTLIVIELDRAGDRAR